MKNYLQNSEKYLKRILKRKITYTSSVLVCFFMMGINGLSPAEEWVLTKDEKDYKENIINKNIIGKPSDKLTGVSVNTSGEQYAFQIIEGKVKIKIENNEVKIDKGKSFKIGEDEHTYNSGKYYRVKTLDAFIKLKELTKSLEDGDHTFTKEESDEIIRLNGLKDNYSNIDNPTALGQSSIAIGNGAQARANNVVAIGNRAGLTNKANKYAYKYKNGYDSEFAQGYNSVFIGERAGYLANTMPQSALTGTIMIGARTGSESEGDGNIYFGSDAGRRAIGSQNMYFGDSAKATHKIPDKDLKYNKLETKNDGDKENYKKYEKYFIGPDYNFSKKSYGNRNLVFSNNFVIQEELEKENRYKDEKGKTYIREGDDFYKATVQWTGEKEVKNEKAKKELEEEHKKNESENHIVFKGIDYIKEGNKFYIAKEEWVKGKKVEDSTIIKGLEKEKPYVSDTIVLGTLARALDDQAIAIGGSKQNYVPGAVAAGKRSIAIGMSKKAEEIGALADADDSVAIGTNAKALKEGSLGIGAYTKAEGENTTAIGFKAEALKENSISYGVGAKAKEMNSIAIGTNSESNGKNSIVLGIKSFTKNDSEFKDDGSGKYYILKENLPKELKDKDKDEITSLKIDTGTKEKYKGEGIILLGNEIKDYTFANNSVVIGNGASGVFTAGDKVYGAATPVRTVEEAEITLPDGLKIKYGGFAGQVKDVGQYVSFGKPGEERQLKNVAPGEISKRSTDAVNGSQLNSLFIDLKKDITANTPYEYQDANTGKVLHLLKGKDGKLYDLSINGVEFDKNKNQYIKKDGTVINPVENIKVVVKGKEPLKLENVASSLTEVNDYGNTEKTNTTVKNVTKPDITKIENNAATVKDILNVGFNLQENGKAKDFVKAYDTVNFVDGDGTIVSVENKDGTTSTIKYSIDKGTITAENGKLKGNTELAAKKEALAKAEKELANATEEAKEQAKKKVDEAQKAVDEINNKVATVENVVEKVNEAISNSGLTFGANLGKNNTDVENKKLTKLGSTIEIVKAENDIKESSNITYKGDNLITRLTQDENTGNSKIEIGIKESPEFKDITLKTNENNYSNINGSGITIRSKEDSKPEKTVSLTKDGLNNGGNKITNVAAGTDKTDAVNYEQLNNVDKNIPFETVVKNDTGTLEKVVLGEDGNYYKLEDIKDKEYVTGKGYYDKDKVENGALKENNLTPVGNVNDKVVIKSKGDTPKELSNIKSNLPITNNTGNEVTNVTKPDITKIENNAATVKDILNVGFNLQEMGKAKDFVKAYDTVNFINGDGTIVSVENKDGTTSTIKYSIDKGTITAENGKLKGNTELAAKKEALAKAKEALDNATNASEEVKKQAQEKVDEAQKAVDEINNKVATVENVVEKVNEAISNSGLTFGANLGKNNTDVENKKLTKLGSTIEIVKAENDIKESSNITYKGDNLITKLTQDKDGNSKIEIALKESPEFKKLTISENSKTLELTSDSIGTKETNDKTVAKITFIEGTPAGQNGTPEAVLPKIDVNGAKITNVAAPTEATDATNKKYVDDELNKKANINDIYTKGEVDNKGITFAGNDKKDIHKLLGSTLNIVGEIDSTKEGYVDAKNTTVKTSANNIYVTKKEVIKSYGEKETELEIGLISNISNIDSITTVESNKKRSKLDFDGLNTEDTANEKETKVNSEGVIVKSGTGDKEVNSKLTGQGLEIYEGEIITSKNKTVINKESIKLTDTKEDKEFNNEITAKLNKLSDKNGNSVKTTATSIVVSDKDDKNTLKIEKDNITSKDTKLEFKENGKITLSNTKTGLTDDDKNVTLSGIKKGTISENSTEAINGEQLNDLATQVGISLNKDKKGFNKPIFEYLMNANGILEQTNNKSIYSALNETRAKLNEGFLVYADKNVMAGMNGTVLKNGYNQQYLGSAINIKTGNVTKSETTNTANTGATGSTKVTNYVGKNLTTEYDNTNGNGTVTIALKETPEFKGIVLEGKNASQNNTIKVDDEGDAVIEKQVMENGVPKTKTDKIITKENIANLGKIKYKTSNGTGIKEKGKEEVKNSEVALSTGFDFQNGKNTTAEIGKYGVVKYNLNKDLKDLNSAEFIKETKDSAGNVTSKVESKIDGDGTTVTEYNKDGNVTGKTAEYKLGGTTITNGDKKSETTANSFVISKKGTGQNATDTPEVSINGSKTENGKTVGPSIDFAKGTDGKGTGKITGLKDVTGEADDVAVNKGYVDNKLGKTNENIEKLNKGEAGTVVYTDEAGNRVVKAEDGKYYAKEDVNEDGKLIYKNNDKKYIKDKAGKYVDIATNKVDTSVNDKTFETNGTPKEKDIKLSLVNNNGTTTPTILSNVKGNLPITNNTGNVLEGTYTVDNEKFVKKGNDYYKVKEDDTLETTKLSDTTKLEKLDKISLVTKPTDEQIAKITNNAATVGDVLNTGFNLQKNGEQKDYVKAYDTVNFVDGDGTIVSVENKDGTTSTIKYSIDKGTITAENGKLVGDTELANTLKKLEEAKTAYSKATEVFGANPNDKNAEEELKKATNELKNAQTKVDNINNKVATVENVVNALNEAGLTFGANLDSDNGTTNNKKLYKLGSTIEIVKATGDAIKEGSGDSAVTYKGDNLITKLKQDKDGNSKIEIALKESPEFKDITLKTDENNYSNINGSGITIRSKEDSKPEKTVSLTKDGLNNGGNKITNVAAGTDKTDAVNVGQLEEVKNQASQNEDAINNNAKNIDKLGGEVRHGLANSAAMSTIQFMDIGINQYTIGAAIGAYKDSQAVAVGIQAAPTENSRVHAKISVSPGKNLETMAGVGASWRFNWE